MRFADPAAIQAMMTVQVLVLAALNIISAGFVIAAYLCWPKRTRTGD